MSSEKIENKTCQNCKNDFTIDSDDFSFYEKIKVPPPTWCPECRIIRRIMWRNERALYKRNCDLCKKSFISIYPSDSPYVVYCSGCWKSDQWDCFSYGQEYNFSKSFFEQFKELQLKVPRQGLVHIAEPIINSDFANYVSEVKNAYLSYSAIRGSEDIYYSKNTDNSKKIFDSLDIVQSESCFECVNGVKNYSCAFSYFSENCIESSFLFNCKNCSNCFGCVGLRNKQYFIWNEQYTKEEYIKEIGKINYSSYKNLQEIKQKFDEYILQFPRHYMNSVNYINSTGFGVKNSKDCKMVFEVYDCENVSYGFRCPGIKDSMDVVSAGWAELMYEFSSGGGVGSQNVKFIANGLQSQMDCEYTDSCGFSSSNLFGCIGVKSGQYSILNKKYLREEYENLVLKIKEHMNTMPYIDAKGRVFKYGEFFPYDICPFAYNETIAQEHFSTTKERALSMGYEWKDASKRDYTLEIATEDLPDDINQADESVVGKVIECGHKGICNEQCTEVFKIISEEFLLYKKMGFPLPRLCPNCRHYERLKKKNPLKLWHRQCMCDKKHSHHEGKCEIEFETSYAPDRKDIVYCNKCYQQEVY